MWLGYGFLWAREYDRAIEQAEKALALEPQAGEPYNILFTSYELQGMEKEAFDAFVVAEDRFRRFSGETGSVRAALQERFDRSGFKGVLQWDLENSLEQPVQLPHRLANLYARLGQKDQAFEWLEELWELPLWGYEASPACPFWDSLRDDPRFEQLLRKLNLPEEAIAIHLTAAQ
jgi:tetratricopeptide (TPR) repeat protein